MACLSITVAFLALISIGLSLRLSHQKENRDSLFETIAYNINNGNTDGSNNNSSSSSSNSSSNGSSNSSSIRSEASAAANLFVDDLLQLIRPTLEEEFNPVDLPEEAFGFEKQILLVVFKGEVKLFDGWIAGVPTLHRTGQGNIVKTTGSSENGCKVTLDAHLGFGSLVGHYKAHAKFMDFGPTVDLLISIPSVSLTISLQQDVNEAASKPDLAFLDIENIGQVGITLNGNLGPLSWIFGKVYSFVGNLVKGFVANQLQKPIRDLLSDKLKNSDISLHQFGCDKLV